MADDPNPQDPPDWKVIAAQWANGFLTEGVPGFVKAWQASSIETHGAIRALDVNLAVDMIVFITEKWRDTEESLMPFIGAMVAPIIGGLFHAGGAGGDFSRRMAAGDGDGVAKAIVSGFLAAVAGNQAGPIEPGVEGSTRIATAAVAATLESELNALIPEIASHFLPFDLGHLSDLLELPESVIRTLSVPRLVRRALSPLVDATCATPAKWHYAKLYRQALLGPGEVARQVARGRWQIEQAKEELARAGYSDERIEALLNAAAKFHTPPDLWRLVRAQQWDEGSALQHLQDAGYEADVARVELLLEKLKAIESFDREMAGAAVTAFADGRIDEGALGGFCSGATISAQEKAQLVELAHARRICNTKSLSPTDAAAAVEAGILSFVDYRRALERDGFDDDAVTVKELLLRHKIDAQKDVETHKAELAAEKLAEKTAREAAALAKKAEHDQAVAAQRRGRTGDLEDAAIRGLVPIARVAELYARDFDDETTGILIARLEARRQDYLAQQAARDAAVQKAATRGADVGQLEAAVAAGVLTLDEFRTRLAQLKFSGADADLIASTLRATIAQRAAAARLHDEAAAAAKVKHVDLGTIELLVRRGHRSLADFDRTLRDLGFDDAARAALGERLSIEIADDAKAAKTRADAEAKLQIKGLSLEQFRRAVILGVRPIAAFETFLVQQHFTAEAVTILVGELQADVAEAVAARQRRADAAAHASAQDAPLSDVARAARLGLVDVGAYVDRLRRDGYTAEAIALEQDLLVAEIADVQAARRTREAAEAKAHDRGLSLAQLERAVKAHDASIAEYVGAARASGLSDEDSKLLGRVLEDELAAAAAAAARKKALAEQQPTRELARGDVAKGVIDGITTLDDYAAWLTGHGYAPDDVDLLVAELEVQLEAKAAKAAGEGA
jgi:hypothetical protein